MMARTGRRPGNPGTREVILDAARAAFAERGFDRASIRQIAAAAGVDPALVYHYFDTKDALFLAAVEAPIDPRIILPRLLADGLDGIGERLVRTFVGIWDSPAGTAAAAVLRSAMSNERSTRMFREFLATQVLRRVVQQIDVPDAELRASLVASQVVGLAIARYILKVEPLASAPAETVVSTIGPTIQRYITGVIQPNGPPSG